MSFNEDKIFADFGLKKEFDLGYEDLTKEKGKEFLFLGSLAVGLIAKAVVGTSAKVAAKYVAKKVAKKVIKSGAKYVYKKYRKSRRRRRRRR